MGYIGNQTSNSYSSMDKQTITGNGGASYTLTHAVANAQEIEVFVNNVRQEAGVAYTVSGTALTMTGNVASTDDFYVIYQGKALQTVVPPDGSVTNAKIDTMAASKLTGALPAIDGSALTSVSSLTSAGRQSLASSNGYTWTGIPSTAKRIIVVYRLYFTQSSTQDKSTILRVGNGSIVTSGYETVSSYIDQSANDQSQLETSGFHSFYWNNGDQNQFGKYELTNLDGNKWVVNGQAAVTEVSGAAFGVAITHQGFISLGGALDRVQLKIKDGTTTYNANSEASLYYAS